MKISPIPSTMHMLENRGPSPRAGAASVSGGDAGKSKAATNVGKFADIVDTSNSPAKQAAAYLAGAEDASAYRNFGAVVSKFARGELPINDTTTENTGVVDGIEGPDASGPTTEETGSTVETDPVVGDEVVSGEGETVETSTAETDPVVEPEASTEEEIVSESDGEETTLTDIAENVVVGDTESTLIDELLEDTTDTV
jgi:hypothetical protein